MSNFERTEREWVAIAIYEARAHSAFINGWDSEPVALRKRFLKAADAALQASGAVEALQAIYDRHHMNGDGSAGQVSGDALRALGIDPDGDTA